MQSQDPTKKSGMIEYPEVSTWQVLKEYLKLMKPYWLVVTTNVLGVIVAVVTTIITPTYYKHFFDIIGSMTGTATVNTGPLVTIIFSVLVLNLINWAAWRSAWFSANYLNAHIMSDALQKSFDYLIEHSYTFFISNFAGALTQKINRFSRAFQVIFERIFFDFLTLIIKVGGACIVLFFINPVMASAIALWIAIFLSVSFIFTHSKLKYDIQAAADNSRLTGAISDTISNHSSVQFFYGFKEESKRVENINTPFMKLNLFRWNLSSTLDGTQALLSVAIEFFVFYYGIKYWQLGVVSLGTFILAQAYIISIGTSLWSFSRTVRDIYQGVADAKEMVEILHLGHGIKDSPQAKELIVDKGGIEFKDIGFGFNKNKLVFDGINLSIKPGEKVALIGTSGAGKSTLVRLLMRLYEIPQGDIFIDGQNIKEVTQKSLRDNVSLVPQDPALFHRSLMENIRYGRRTATDDEVIAAAKLAHCDEFINELPLKYGTYVGERGVKLSGGERQRVAIARAILKNAPILVLDEATSSLDSHSEMLIQDALHTLMKGKTTIVIAHRLSTIRKMDRIIVISKGGVVEDGSHDDLLRKPNGIYSKLWSLQAGGFANKSIEDLLQV